MSGLDESVYRELHALARRRLGGQRQGHTLQPTALVNEAWLKLNGSAHSVLPSAVFVKTAAAAMRQILVDHARARGRLKRGGGARAAVGVEVGDLADSSGGSDADPDQLLCLDDALSRLERLDPQAADVVKLRFFAGRSVEETAATLDISERTVKRDWQFARAWLAKELSEPR